MGKVYLVECNARFIGRAYKQRSSAEKLAEEKAKNQNNSVRVWCRERYSDSYVIKEF